MSKDKLTLNDKKLYQLDDHNIHLFFSTRHGGQSKLPFNSLNLALHVNDNPEDVLINRHTYTSFIGMSSKQMVFCKQTHSINSHLVTKADLEAGFHDQTSAIKDCDALYTFDYDICLNTFHADCTPVYFYSHVDHLVGVIHAGWQGSVAAITYHTLAKVIKEHQIKPENISIVIGPTIQKQSFRVQKDVIDKLTATKLIDSSLCYTKVDETHYLLDNSLLNKLQCQALGITKISCSTEDTYTNDDFFSYRKNNKTGRMCASIYQTSK